MSFSVHLCISFHEVMGVIVPSTSPRDSEGVAVAVPACTWRHADNERDRRHIEMRTCLNNSLDRIVYLLYFNCTICSTCIEYLKPIAGRVFTCALQRAGEAILKMTVIGSFAQQRLAVDAKTRRFLFPRLRVPPLFYGSSAGVKRQVTCAVPRLSPPRMV
jgi:hypothetical protein